MSGEAAQGGIRVETSPGLDRAGDPSWRVRLNEAFTGLSWPAVVVTMLLCVYSALDDWMLELAGPIRWSEWLILIGTDLLTTLAAGVIVLLATFAGLNRLRSPGRRPWLALATYLLAGSAMGVALKFLLDQALFDVAGVFQMFGGQALKSVQYFVRYVTLATLFTAAYVLQRRAMERIDALHRAGIERVRLDHQAEEARLQVLQAQIEPHFLFNTLANVRRLYATDPSAAGTMLENLMRYLSTALPQMRSAGSTLGREAMLVEAYLDIQKVRMGERLTYTIDLPDSLRESPMPPMMLLTLVENAVKHGIGPLPEGGAIRIRARDDHGEMRVEVLDSGRGFTQASGTGTGLANVRGRLKALHGSAARLSIGLNHPRGAAVAIAFPREPASERQ